MRWPSTWITCQPNCVLTGSEIWPSFSLKAASAKGRHHALLGEPAEIAALGSRVLRHLLGDLGEILTGLEPLQNRLGIRLGGDEHVTGVDLLLRLLRRRSLIVDLVQGRIVGNRLGDAGQHRLHQDLVLGIFHLGREARRLIRPVGFGLLRHQSGVDEVIEDVGVARLALELLLQLRSEILGGQRHVELCDLLAVDGGEYRLGWRRWDVGRRRRRSRHRRSSGRRLRKGGRRGESDGGGDHARARPFGDVHARPPLGPGVWREPCWANAAFMCCAPAEKSFALEADTANPRCSGDAAASAGFLPVDGLQRTRTSPRWKRASGCKVALASMTEIGILKTAAQNEGARATGRLVIVSNRVPVPTAAGSPPPGGLAVALSGALEKQGGLWFGWSGKVATQSEPELHKQTVGNVDYAVADLSQRDIDEY